MPHLGTQPPTGFKTTTKQSFSGDNSTTAFTLNRASSSNTDLEVFVDNIQQEPTTAYSVIGTTLTFTEAPPTGTNNVYVVNRGGDQNGTLPPQDLGTTDYIFGDDISFNSDSAKLNFGADSDITITHVADTGLNLKNANTGDDNPMVLTLQTGDTDIAADDVLGAINFQAPDEGTGTDAILVAAGIEAVSEGDFSSSSNATKLSFKTGASEAASEKMSIASTGATTITTSGNEATLSLVSTDADANAGPQLVFNRNSASPADNDLLGKIKYSGNDDGGNSVDYATVNIRAKDVSDGSEDGEYDISTIVGGTSRSRVRIDGSETIFNENSVDVDFRVESNGDANMFFVDGGNDRIYMGRNVTDGVGNARLQIEAQDGEAGLSIHRGSASTGGGKIFFSKSRAATAGDDTVVQDGDQLGALLFTGADGTDRESAGAEISVEVNGTPGSNDMPGRIMFATTADGAAAVTERMRIPSDGRILFGCTSEPTNSVSGVQLSNAGTFSSCKFSVGNNVGNFTQISFINGNGVVGTIKTNAAATAYNTSSDYRLKENVVTDWDATTRLKQLKPSRFNWKTAKDTTLDGFLAHEVSSIVPEAISGEKDAMKDESNVVLNADGTVCTWGVSKKMWEEGKLPTTDEDGKTVDPIYASDTTWVESKSVPDHQAIDQSKLVPLLTKALQEAISEIETLKTKVTALEGG